MPPRVRYLISVCERLKKSNNVEKTIKEASDKEIIALIEFFYNLMHSNVPLYKNETTRLSRHKGTIENLSQIRHINLARNKIIQSGGSIIPLIVSAALALAKLI